MESGDFEKNDIMKFFKQDKKKGYSLTFLQFNLQYLSDRSQNPNVRKTIAPINRIKYSLGCITIIFNYDYFTFYKVDASSKSQALLSPSPICIYVKKQRIYEPELEILKVFTIHLSCLLMWLDDIRLLRNRLSY